ncbi:broad specificity phosphatase PhoE [Microbacterium sp. ZKA21]|uniref:histidine phosphatase family protein n=1 Tax=Microbacterium sp. ZKA21 TaxID=3381694 RepID=UPI003D2142B2
MAGMNRILLVRHAQAQGHSEADPPLDATGEQQALLLAERLAQEETGPVLSSPKRRAQQTAQVIGRRVGTSPDVSDLLDDLTPMPSSDRWTDYPEHRWPWLEETPVDEQDLDAVTLNAAWTTLHDAAESSLESGALVLITHAFVVASFVSRALGAPPAAWMQLPVANASITEIELRPGREAVIVGFNDVCHLRTATAASSR